MKLYTLSIIDEDGTITGDKGAVIVPSMEINLKEDAQTIDDLDIGEAMTYDKVPYPLTQLIPTLILRVVLNSLLFNEGKLRLHICSTKPNQTGISRDEAILVWQRIE